AHWGVALTRGAARARAGGSAGTPEYRGVEAHFARPAVLVAGARRTEFRSGLRGRDAEPVLAHGVAGTRRRPDSPELGAAHVREIAVDEKGAAPHSEQAENTMRDDGLEPPRHDDTERCRDHPIRTETPRAHERAERSRSRGGPSSP